MKPGRGWARANVLDLVSDMSRLATKIPQSDYLETGHFPIIDQGATPVAGYVNEVSALYRGELPVIVFGDHTRALKFVGEQFAVGADGVKVLAPRSNVDPRYAYQVLRSLDIPSAGYSRHFKFLKEYSVPVPPLDEQRRIAAVLDRVDTLRSRCKRTISMLDSLELAMLARIPSGGDERKLRNLGVGFTAGRSVVGVGSDADEDRRVIKVSAVSSGRFLDYESKALPVDYRPPVDHRLRQGDLLITRASGSANLIGVTTFVPSGIPELYLPDKVWRVELEEEELCHARYLHSVFKSPEFRSYIRDVASGASGVKNVSKSKFLNFSFRFGDISDQRVFAARVEKVDTFRESVKRRLVELDTLFASLQSRAFAGELDVSKVVLLSS